MKRSPLRTYEGQIKAFLVLLVLFLAVAIYCNVHLLVIARNAIQEEAGQRLAREADLVLADLERDQMVRGLRRAPAEVPYIPPTYLDRIARIEGMRSIAILSIDGRILSSSDPAKVGTDDLFLAAPDGLARRTLAIGRSVITPLDRAAGSGHATLGAYSPIRDRRRELIAVIHVEREMPVLAGVDRSLRAIAALQAGGLVLLLILVILFARWLLQPYRRLLSAAAEAPGALRGLSGTTAHDGTDELLGAFRGVLDKLRDQEQALAALTPNDQARAGGRAFPGERLIGGMTSAVLVFDAEGRLAVLNPAAARLLDLDRASATGSPYFDLFRGHPRLIALIEESLRSGRGHSREVLPLSGPSGRQTHLGAMISPIRPLAEGGDGARSIDGVICLLTDLTEIKALRERVGLKENLVALGEMSAGIAHEFRNSLATIQGYARLIARSSGGKSGEDGEREHAEAILREVKSVERVVRDFLRYARPADLDLHEVDLARMIRDEVADFAGEYDGRGVRIEVEGTFAPIQADETLLRQAIQNLLRNAAEALTGRNGEAPAGSNGDGCIIVRGGDDPADPGGVRITIIDNGPGIGREDLNRLFTPFFTTKERGTGLGLALVQKAAVLHDGRVEVTSEPGQGASFTLILPGRPGQQGSSGTLS